MNGRQKRALRAELHRLITVRLRLWDQTVRPLVEEARGHRWRAVYDDWQPDLDALDHRIDQTVHRLGVGSVRTPTGNGDRRFP